MSKFPRVAQQCPLPSPLNGSLSPFATGLAHGQNVVDRSSFEFLSLGFRRVGSRVVVVEGGELQQCFNG